MKLTVWMVVGHLFNGIVLRLFGPQADATPTPDLVERPDQSVRAAAPSDAYEGVIEPAMGLKVDAHWRVIAGDIMSPDQTDDATTGQLDWVRTLEAG